jgi:hypothetical protein
MTETTENTYKDGFTLDGRLNPRAMPGVTKAKVAKVKQLMEAALRGDRIANATLAETISSSDAVFNAVYLTQIQALPQFDRLPRTWSEIAGVRVLPDFRPAVLQGVFGEFVGFERGGSTQSTTTGPANPAGILPVREELAPYAYATVGSVESAYGRIKVRGGKVGWSFEAQVNDDAAGFFAQIPGELLQTALDTEEWEVYTALLNGLTASEQLDGGTTYTGATVLPNAPISKDAIVRAIYELTQRTVNGRLVGRSTTGYNILVPLGTREAVEFALSQAIIQIQDGSFVLSAQELGLGSITVIESEYITGTNWYVIPKKNGIRRPFLELGRLRGHEAPELRIENATGNYIGGAAVSPFEGSFYNDSIDVRVRYPITGILWFKEFGLWSQGDGVE